MLPSDVLRLLRIAHDVVNLEWLALRRDVVADANEVPEPDGLHLLAHATAMRRLELWIRRRLLVLGVFHVNLRSFLVAASGERRKERSAVATRRNGRAGEFRKRRHPVVRLAREL